MNSIQKNFFSLSLSLISSGIFSSSEEFVVGKGRQRVSSVPTRLTPRFRNLCLFLIFQSPLSFHFGIVCMATNPIVQLNYTPPPITYKMRLALILHLIFILVRHTATPFYFPFWAQSFYFMEIKLKSNSTSYDFPNLFLFWSALSIFPSSFKSFLKICIAMRFVLILLHLMYILICLKI